MDTLKAYLIAVALFAAATIGDTANAVVSGWQIEVPAITQVATVVSMDVTLEQNSVEYFGGKAVVFNVDRFLATGGVDIEMFELAQAFQNPGSITLGSGSTLSSEAVGISGGLSDAIQWGRDHFIWLGMLLLVIGLIVFFLRRTKRV